MASTETCCGGFQGYFFPLIIIPRHGYCFNQRKKKERRQSTPTVEENKCFLTHSKGVETAGSPAGLMVGTR